MIMPPEFWDMVPELAFAYRQRHPLRKTWADFSMGYAFPDAPVFVSMEDGDKPATLAVCIANEQKEWPDTIAMAWKLRASRHDDKQAASRAWPLA